MKYPLLGMLALTSFSQPKQAKIDVKYIQQANEPLVSFRAAPGFELTFTGQHALQLSAEAQTFETMISCTNMLEVSWKTETNQVYRLLKGASVSKWQYTNIKVIGDGNTFHFYDFVDQSIAVYKVVSD